MDTMQSYEHGVRAARQLAQVIEFKSYYGTITVEDRNGATVIVVHLRKHFSANDVSLPQLFEGFKVEVGGPIGGDAQHGQYH